MENISATCGSAAPEKVVKTQVSRTCGVFWFVCFGQGL